MCVLSSAQRPVSPSAPRGVSDFSHCYGQTANEKQLKGARADLGLRSFVVHLGGEDAAAGKGDGLPPFQWARERRKGNATPRLGWFLVFLIQSRTPADGLMMSHSVWVFPSVHPF